MKNRSEYTRSEGWLKTKTLTHESEVFLLTEGESSFDSHGLWPGERLPTSKSHPTDLVRATLEESDTSLYSAAGAVMLSQPEKRLLCHHAVVWYVEPCTLDNAHTQSISRHCRREYLYYIEQKRYLASLVFFVLSTLRTEL